MNTDNKDAVRVAFEHVERESELSMTDGTYDNPCVQSAWDGYRAAHAAQAEQIALLQQALLGRQEEIGRLNCRVGELEAERVGWKLVPIEPTEAMMHAAEDVPAPRPYGAVYRAMLTAAPDAPVAPSQAIASAEPVAIVERKEVHGSMCVFITRTPHNRDIPDGTLLYTRPATQAASPSMTNEKIREILHKYSRYMGQPDYYSDTEFACLQDVIGFARAIEAHLKGECK